jgi:NADH-ubiquinone oxidoreductase chain 4L
MNFVYYLYIVLFFMSYAFFYFLAYNIFIGLVYLELASLSVSVLLVLHSLFLDDRYFEFFAISLMTIAGAESAVAISLLVSMNRLSVALTSEEFSTLKL